MKLADAVKPISYVKAHAAEIIDALADGGAPLVITQNGEAKAVLMSVQEYDQMQQSMAMVKLLAQSSRSLEEGRFRPAEEVFSDLLKRRGR